MAQTPADPQLLSHLTGWLLLFLTALLLGGVLLLAILIPRILRRQRAAERPSRPPVAGDPWAESARRLPKPPPEAEGEPPAGPQGKGQGNGGPGTGPGQP